MSLRLTPEPCGMTMIDPTSLPWASLTSTLVLAALGRAKTISATTVASVGRLIGFMREIIAIFEVTRPRGHGLAMLGTGRWSILRESFKSFRGKCNDGGGAGDGTGSGGRFPGAGR